ncbi:MAG: ABC transporter ATP-binding protein [Dictyoglomaceae bacterium]|nr:ABC transporter ATP-binding protein [Dictyoglomaceae bacterium]
MEEIIRLEGITKIFPDVIANDNVDLSINAGEIHAIVGENGAGKSTLMKVLDGLYKPDKGKIYIKGKKVTINDPKDAIALGIGMVHQHFMLIPPFSVLENIILGAEPKNGPFLNFKKAEEMVKKFSEGVGFNIDLHTKVEDLSVGEAQRVEIMKLLYRGADILILDEPTAVLAPQEIEELFLVLRKLNSQGKTIIFISHKLNEVLDISHRITVMRKGKVVSTLETKNTTKQEIAQLMVGREVFLKIDKNQVEKREEIIRIEDLWIKGRKENWAVNGVSFNIRGGEILGIAGVEGNGQSELVEGLVGLLPIKKGRIIFKGKDITEETVRQRRLNIGHIPEDRHKRGLILDFSVAENSVLGFHFFKDFSKGVFLDYKKINEHAEKIVKEYDVKTPNIKVPIRNLSGGNQQKIIAGREISFSPEFLIASQPTRGLDIGATEFIHQLLVKLREEGKAILLVSADLDELLNLSDRILVMYNGEIVGAFLEGEADEKELGYYMTGVKRQENLREVLL